MIFLKKYTLRLLLLSSCALVCQEEPTTPPRKAKSGFFHTGDSSSESEASSAASSAFTSPVGKMSTGKTVWESPLRRSIEALLVASPGKRAFDEVENEILPENSPNNSPKKRKIALSFQGRLAKSLEVDRPRDLVNELKEELDKVASLEELKKRYQIFQRVVFNADSVKSHDSENYDDIIRKTLLVHFFKVARSKNWDTAFLQLPIFSLSHFTEPDTTGGYHKENLQYPVKRILENPKTHVYGGKFTLAARKTGEKFSCMVPKEMALEKVVEEVPQAFQHILASRQNKRLGISNSGIPWEIYLQNATEATSVFPLVAYVDATKDTGPLELHLQKDALIKEEFTHKQLIEFALKVHKKSDDALYTFPDAEILDIAPEITGDPDARGVYIKVLKSDLK